MALWPRWVGERAWLVERLFSFRFGRERRDFGFGFVKGGFGWLIKIQRGKKKKQVCSCLLFFFLVAVVDWVGGFVEAFQTGKTNWGRGDENMIFICWLAAIDSLCFD